MDDMASQTSEPTPAKTSAPKDKNCPFCGQAFTSSSLGRHLDLYIKDKNPKPSDGIHDVEAIKKLRGGITRRQPRGSIGARKDSTPLRKCRFSSKRETTLQDDESTAGKPAARNGSYDATPTSNKFPFLSCWDATSVTNDISAKGPGVPMTASKQAMQKTQIEAKQKLADAMDTARAAELALQEILGSWRAAK